MSPRRVRAPHIDFGPLRRELNLPDGYPPDAQTEAERATVSRPPTDLTDVPFATIDPPASLDLDQAMCLERRAGGGYRVRYAIADVASWVRPAGPLDGETWRRGQTVYLPDGNVPLHPRVLGEGAASLLPDQDRPAVVWTIDLAADGATTAVRVERALVRSRAKLNYAQVQSDVDAGRAAEPVALLPEIGKLLVERGLARGAINLPTPEQEVERDGAGWRLTLRGQPPIEAYNAQLSLLTGVCAAAIMLDGGVGLLRTMPAAKPEAVATLKAAAPALGVAWPDGASVGAVVAALDPADPGAAAFLDQAAELMRGAGYTPLRRLADRYATEVCLALHDGAEVPSWARGALPRLPDVMRRTDQLAGAAARGAVDLAEAVLLAGRVGAEFAAVVLDDHPGTVAVADPPVRARCAGDGLNPGARVRVRLMEADPDRRKILFGLA